MCFTAKVMQPKLHNTGWEWPWLVRLWCVDSTLHSGLRKGGGYFDIGQSESQTVRFPIKTVPELLDQKTHYSKDTILFCVNSTDPRGSEPRELPPILTCDIWAMTENAIAPKIMLQFQNANTSRHQGDSAAIFLLRTAFFWEICQKNSMSTC